jgi:hypothetical protein
VIEHGAAGARLSGSAGTTAPTGTRLAPGFAASTLSYPNSPTSRSRRSCDDRSERRPQHPARRPRTGRSAAPPAQRAPHRPPLPRCWNHGTTSPSMTRPTWHSPKRWTPPCSPATADSPGHQDPAPHRDPPAHTLTPARVARPTAKRGCPGRRRPRIRPIQTPERPPERDRAAWAARRSS